MTNIYTFILPDIGEGVVEGEVIEWFKKEGDPVSKDEPVVSVMTDKATVELPSPVSGKLVKRYYAVGEIAKVDQPLYDIETQEISSKKPESKSPEKKTKPKAPKQTSPLEKRPSEKALALPRTRKLAKELEVDIDLVSGTGKEGRVTDEDVIRFQHKKKTPESQRASPTISHSTPILHMTEDQQIPVSGLRSIVAEKMVESKYIIPHFSYFDQADATRLIQLRENIKKEAKKEGYALTYMPFLIRALSLTIRKYPICNSSFDLETHSLVIHHHQNIGIAKSTEKGLMVCVLKEVQEMSLDNIIKTYHELMLKAKEGNLQREDLIGSTITITNFGPLGGLFATPIINYPEAAILGIAKIRKTPVVKNDEVVIRDLLNLSWSFDHRIIDGNAAAAISNTFIDLIQNPAQML